MKIKTILPIGILLTILGCANSPTSSGYPAYQEPVVNIIYEPSETILLPPTKIVWDNYFNSNELKQCKNFKDTNGSPDWEKINECYLENLTNSSFEVSVKEDNSNFSGFINVISTGSGKVNIENKNYEIISEWSKYSLLPSKYARSDRPFGRSFQQNKIGVAVRIKANINVKNTATSANINLKSLLDVAAAADAGNISGSLSVAVLGLSGRTINSFLPVTSELKRDSLLRAIEATQNIKLQIYDKSTRITPVVLGSSISGQSKAEYVNPDSSKRVEGWIYAGNFTSQPMKEVKFDINCTNNCKTYSVLKLLPVFGTKSYVVKDIIIKTKTKSHDLLSSKTPIVKEPLNQFVALITTDGDLNLRAGPAVDGILAQSKGIVKKGTKMNVLQVHLNPVDDDNSFYVWINCAFIPSK